MGTSYIIQYSAYPNAAGLVVIRSKGARFVIPLSCLDSIGARLHSQWKNYDKAYNTYVTHIMSNQHSRAKLLKLILTMQARAVVEF